MTFGHRLRRARKAKHYTQKALAQLIGAKHNSISNWETDQNMPDAAAIESICGVLDVTPNHLLMGEEVGVTMPGREGFTTAERALVQAYRALDTAAKGAVDALLGYYQAAVATQPVIRLVKTTSQLEWVSGRISKQSVAAGFGTYLDPDAFDTRQIQRNHLTSRASFYVPVAGDSMEPRFHDGDILAVADVPVEQGEIGIFTVNGSGYVKVRGEGKLLSLNAAYAPIPMSGDVLCNGKVIGVLNPDWIGE